MRKKKKIVRILEKEKTFLAEDDQRIAYRYYRIGQDTKTMVAKPVTPLSSDSAQDNWNEGDRESESSTGGTYSLEPISRVSVLLGGLNMFWELKI